MSVGSIWVRHDVCRHDVDSERCRFGVSTRIGSPPRRRTIDFSDSCPSVPPDASASRVRHQALEADAFLAHRKRAARAEHGSDSKIRLAADWFIGVACGNPPVLTSREGRAENSPPIYRWVTEQRTTPHPSPMFPRSPARDEPKIAHRFIGGDSSVGRFIGVNAPLRLNR